MFVHRLTWNAKGSLNAAAALMKEFWERFPPPHPVRILTSWLYPNDVVAVEHEFASLAEYEEFWKEQNRWYDTSPEFAAWRSENGERWEATFNSQEMWEVR